MVAMRTGAAGRRWGALGAVAALALVLSACMPQPGAQPRSAAPTTAAPCSTRWCPVLRQDFTKEAEAGSFEQAYGSDLSGYRDGHADTSGHGQYWPSRVLSASKGSLDWWVHSQGNQPMTAAPLPQGYVGQKWGRWSVRFRSDSLPGYKLAFLLWPDSDRWSDGELDFPEGELGQDIYGYAHNAQGHPERNVFKFDPKAKMSTWHTATLEWTPEHLTYSLDGSAVKSTTNPKALPQVAMHPVLQVETSLEGPAPDPSVQGHVQVDWIQIERYNAQTQ
jgi:hypothetical protein